MRRTDSLEKTLMLGKTEGGRGDNRAWDGWMASLTQWTWVWVSSGSWWWTGNPDMLQFMGSQRVRHDWATEPDCYSVIKRRKIWPFTIMCMDLESIMFSETSQTEKDKHSFLLLLVSHVLKKWTSGNARHIFPQGNTMVTFSTKAVSWKLWPVPQ